MYAFSTENWSRQSSEISDLWNVIKSFSDKFYNWAITKNVRVKIIGDLSDYRIPSSLRNSLERLELDSYSSYRNHVDADVDPDYQKGLTICIAINYGGRKDIINASLKMAELISKGEIILNDSNRSENNYDDTNDIETIFSDLLCTSNIPDPDLVIRTGGEQRLSNFLIWNCAYSELYFSDLLWPDYSEKELDICKN